MSNVNSTRADGAASMMLSFEALSNPQPASGHFLVAARGSHHRMSGRPDPGHLGFTLRECEAKQGHGSAGEIEVVGGLTELAGELSGIGDGPTGTTLGAHLPAITDDAPSAPRDTREALPFRASPISGDEIGGDWCGCLA